MNEADHKIKPDYSRVIINRKNGESILIGENIHITLIKKKGGVSFYIIAPRDLIIDREEVNRHEVEFQGFDYGDGS